jgi:hypothetical protein
VIVACLASRGRRPSLFSGAAFDSGQRRGARDEEDSSACTLMRALVSDLTLSPGSFIDAEDSIETARRHQ